MQNNHVKIWNPLWSRAGLTMMIVNGGRNFYNMFFRRVLQRYLGPDTIMLELGCGSSSLSISLASRAKKVIGLDISDEAIRFSQKNAAVAQANNMEFVRGDCCSVPYENKFHFVWSNGLLEHFDDPVEIARQHFKAVRPGGIALLCVPYYYSYHNLWYTLTRPRILRFLWLWPGVEQVFFTRSELQKIGSLLTPHSRTFFLKPFILGMVFLELKKLP